MNKVTRYYVDYSSIFNSMDYNVPKIKKAIENAGGKNIRTSMLHGWSNQPDVVTFSANSDDLKSINKKASTELGDLALTWGLILHEKNW